MSNGFCTAGAAAMAGGTDQGATQLAVGIKKWTHRLNTVTFRQAGEFFFHRFDVFTLRPSLVQRIL